MVVAFSVRLVAMAIWLRSVSVAHRSGLVCGDVPI